jgi:hypothetical protein
MIKNRFYDDLNSTDGQTYLLQVVDWANEFIDELETEVNSDGAVVDWIWVRQLAVTLGTAVTNGTQVPWDDTSYNNLVASTERFVQVLSTDGTRVLANFTVVAPDDMSNDSSRLTQDLCCVVNGNINFSRPFTSGENNGIIVGDVTGYLPRIQTTIGTNGLVVATNVDIFKTVKPLLLLKLGTVKNSILPDIVMGGLNPSYQQKYNDLLTNAISRSEASALAPTADYDDLQGVVHGVGF